MEEHPFMTVDEVAAKFKTSRMTVYRLVQAGHLEAVRVGRAYRVKRASVAAFIDRGGVTE